MAKSAKPKPPERLGPRRDLRSDNRMPGLLDAREEMRNEIKLLQERVQEIDNELEASIGDAVEAIYHGWRVKQSVINMPERILPPTSFKRKFITRISRRAVNTPAYITQE